MRCNRVSRTLAFATATAVAILTTATIARADDPAGGGIVYAKEGRLWWQARDVADDSIELAAIPSKDPVTSIQLGSRLANALVQAGDAWYWIPLDAARRPRKLACRGPARLSVNGRCIICKGEAGQALLYVVTGKQQKMVLPFGDGPFAFAGSDRLAVVRKTGVWTTTPKGTKKRRLASHVPSRDFLPTPNGKRAVGFYEGEQPGLYSFRLDGKGARRKLLNEGTPVTWSRSSEWLLVQQPETACVVRGVGGQYKCWDKLIAGAISGDGGEVFLIKSDGGKHEIHVALTDGARPKATKKLLDGTDPAAAWTDRRPAAQSKRPAPAPGVNK